MMETQVERKATFLQLREHAGQWQRRESVAPGLPSAFLAPLLPEGIPAGTITAVQGMPGGRSLAAFLLREDRGYSALLDDGTWHGAALAEAGVALSRLLIIPICKTDWGLHMRLLDVLVRLAKCSYIITHAATLNMAAWQPNRFARLQAVVSRSATRLIILTNAPLPSLQNATYLRLTCTLEEIAWLGGAGPLARLGGYHFSLSIAAHRRNAGLVGKSMRVDCTFEAQADRVCARTFFSNKPTLRIAL